MTYLSDSLILVLEGCRRKQWCSCLGMVGSCWSLGASGQLGDMEDKVEGAARES